MSMAAKQNTVVKSPPSSAEPIFPNDENMSRIEIEQALGSKDPAWFKQTQDRGAGSAAFRKNQEESSDTVSLTGSLRLPGFSRESTAEPESLMCPPENVRSASPSREGSVRGYASSRHRPLNSASLSSGVATRSPLPMIGSQLFEPPLSDTSSSHGGDVISVGRTMAMSPSQGRISPERTERPVSPTKGLGGFVQSAMLKRSDSVNKRWSAQGGPGLSRGNSIASNRSGYEGSRYPIGGITPLVELRPNSTSRENSPTPNSRPGSSHSNAAISQDQKNQEKFGNPAALSGPKSDAVESEILKPTKLKNRPSPPPNDIQNEPVVSPPASPSKKWSPTKASWLENAINKPDSPKLKSPAPQQPAWMAEINRAKQQRGSVDLSKGRNFKEVTTGGLIRSPPPGTNFKGPNLGGLPNGSFSRSPRKPQDGNVDKVDPKQGLPEAVDTAIVKQSSSPIQQPAVGEPINDATLVENKTSHKTIDKSMISPPSDKNLPQVNDSARSPTSIKPKPETPPKKDFTSVLKPRQVSAEAKKKNEPEFKNVFGKLKRTQTQNYVAPDELKDNILRGKAGLSLTGGPKKTEHKDEFKESILEKKKGMILPSASTRIASNSSTTGGSATPEAIAKRNDLTRSESNLRNGIDATEGKSEASKPEAVAKLQLLQDKPKMTLPGKQPPTSEKMQESTGGSESLRGDFSSSLAGMLQRGPSPMTNGNWSSIAPSSDHGSDREPVFEGHDSETVSAGPQLTHKTKARARGPKRRLPTASKQESAVVVSKSEPAAVSQTHPAENQNSVPASSGKVQTSPSGASRPEPRPLSNITDDSNNSKPVLPSAPRKPSTGISQPRNINSPSSKAKELINGGPTPSLPTNEQIKIIPDDRENDHLPVPIQLSSPNTLINDLVTKKPTQIIPEIASDALEKNETEHAQDNGSLPSVRGAAALWGRSPKHAQMGQPRSPIKLPTRRDEEAALREAGIKPRESDGPENFISPNGPQPWTGRESPTPPTKSPKSPPLPGKKPLSIPGKTASIGLLSSTATQSTSPVSQPTTIFRLLANIFDEPRNSKASINIDTQAALDLRYPNNTSQKIKTLRKQIFEIVGNGKSAPVPSHQEHILFEESLYLCTHVFGSAAGNRTTEVYLWCGDGVSSASIEDSQLFARKVTKDSNGKLIILRQGKETANFFQALGGIVITRRGSGRESDTSPGSAASYMLCGRQYIGQIAFDEVDFHPQSLCKGFPYIVSTGSGKLYLWKGSGSGADELGCARLIGMDLGVTGEIEEVDEGREPEAFWSSFPAGGRDAAKAEAASRQPWHLKPSCDNYTTRLFVVQVEAPRPKSNSSFLQWGRRGSAPANEANTPVAAQIRELTPFTQSDLVDDKIFVLDAFFEIFVYVFPLLNVPILPMRAS